MKLTTTFLAMMICFATLAGTKAKTGVESKDQTTQAAAVSNDPIEEDHMETVTDRDRDESMDYSADNGDDVRRKQNPITSKDQAASKVQTVIKATPPVTPREQLLNTPIQACSFRHTLTPQLEEITQIDLENLIPSAADQDPSTSAFPESAQETHATLEAHQDIASLPTLPLAPLEMNVFPNPANQQVNINLNSGQEANINAEMYDLTGRMITPIHSGPVNTGGRNNFNLNVSQYPAGVYFIRASGETQTTTRRLVITH